MKKYLGRLPIWRRPLVLGDHSFHSWLWRLLPRHWWRQNLCNLLPQQWDFIQILFKSWTRCNSFPVGIGAFANFLPEIGEIVGSRPKYGGEYKVEQLVQQVTIALLGEQPKAVRRRLRQRQLCEHHQLPLWLLSSGQGGCQLWGLLPLSGQQFF